MRELINILCPKWKPLKEWSDEDKRTAKLFILCAVLFVIAEIINSL